MPESVVRLIFGNGVDMAVGSMVSPGDIGINSGPRMRKKCTSAPAGVDTTRITCCLPVIRVAQAVKPKAIAKTAAIMLCFRTKWRVGSPYIGFRPRCCVFQN